jgi:amidophosphoribosyltransferase
MELLSTEYKNVSPWKSSIIVDKRWVCYKIRHEPGERYISEFQHAQPIQDVSCSINDRINQEMAAHPEYADDVALQKQRSHIGELFLGHVRYGTFGK